jgi:hypothetical protein
LIQRAKNSNEGTDFLVTSVINIDASFDQIVPSTVQVTQEEYESFISCRISEQVEIHLQRMFVQREEAKELREPQNYLNCAMERIIRM